MWRYMTARDRYFQCLLRVLLYRNRDGYTFRIEVNAVYLDQLYGSRNVFIRLLTSVKTVLTEVSVSKIAAVA